MRDIIRLLPVAAPLLFLTVLVGCSGTTSSAPTEPSSSAASVAADTFPDVVDVEVTESGEGSFDFTVTISSPYDTPERYADGWRVTTPSGDLLGEHMLTHDHAAEQPFTRAQTGVQIPDDITEVIVEGRDQANGYGGETRTVQLPRS